MLVTICHIEPTNQRAVIQCLGIFYDTGTLLGRKAVVCLVDYFLERRVTDVQSDLGVWGKVLRSWHSLYLRAFTLS